MTDNDFDPENVEKYRQLYISELPMKEDKDGDYVKAYTYNNLLELYRELQARHEQLIVDSN